MPKVVIVVNGGNVQEVISDEPVEYCVLDYDCIEASDVDPNSIDHQAVVTLEGDVHRLAGREAFSEAPQGDPREAIREYIKDAERRRRQLLHLDDEETP